MPWKDFDGQEHQTMHTGGMVWRRAHTGLAIDEVPIIAQAGEGILSRRGMRRLGLDGLHALNHGAGLGGGVSIGDVHVHMGAEADEAEVAEAIIRKLRRSGVRFTRR